MSRSVALPLTRSPAAVAEARAALRTLLADAGLTDLAHDAQLAVSELVTNAVVHTRGAISLRATTSATGVRIEVSDTSPLPPAPALLQTTGMSGRGLLLVARLAAAWGTDATADGKVVWAELARDGGADYEELTVDALIAAWADVDVMGNGGDTGPRRVLLRDLPTAALVEVKARGEDLGREVALIVRHANGYGARLLEVARRLDRLMHDLAPMRRAIRAQALAAAARGDERVDLELHVSPHDADRIDDYAAALDDADDLAAAGELLTIAADDASAGFRRAYLRAIAAQTRGRSDAEAAGAQQLQRLW